MQLVDLQLWGLAAALAHLFLVSGMGIGPLVAGLREIAIHDHEGGSR